MQSLRYRGSQQQIRPAHETGPIHKANLTFDSQGVQKKVNQSQKQ